MFSAHLSSLLAGTIADLPRVVMENSLQRDVDELVAMALPPMKLAIVDDSNTKGPFGEQVFKALKGHFPCTHITLPGVPVADENMVRYLQTQALSADALVAVGSGTINDLCKYVSALSKKPYIVFPTAASMNGYLSANASITVNGHKKTLPAQMPKAVFCDLSVIANAPLRLSKSGLGDCLARPTAQADWLLSHLLLNTPYDEKPFQLLASCEPELFENARGIAKADMETIALLMKVLLLSGLGMTIAGGSYPASGGEHMIAHAMEMRVAGRGLRGTNFSMPTSPLPVLHGEAIGVTTLTMAHIQETLLRGQPQFRPNDFDETKITALYGEKVMREAKEAFGKKILLCHSRGSGNLDLQSVLLKIPQQVRDDVSPARLSSILKAAEAPTTPEELGWDLENYNVAIATARYLRERFGFLDLI